MEDNPVYLVALLGFIIAVVFGLVASKTNFCTMGAISDWVNFGSADRLASWWLAIGIAIVGTQGLELFGIVDVSSAIYRSSTFGMLSYVVGGLLFGIGMTLAGGCGQRNLVRFGNGNLKALIVLLVLAITAYMTLRGILGLIRVNLFDPFATNLSDHNIGDQGIATVIGHWFGLGDFAALRWSIALVIGLLFIVVSLRRISWRENTDEVLAGLVIGAVIVAGWFITGYIGNDDFEPVPLQSMTFVAPTGNSVNYLMTFTGSTISFGIATVFGVILGAFIYAVFSRKFRIETFSDRSDMVSHLVGASLMGFGGVLALGCTIGQGITGVSTLAMGSFIAVIAIMVGSAVTMKVQYHRLSELGWGAAITQGLLDTIIPGRDSG